MYAGRLEVRLCEAKELAREQDLAQVLVSGASNDSYVVFAMNEENEEGPKEGAIGLGRAVVRARVEHNNRLRADARAGTRPGHLRHRHFCLHMEQALSATCVIVISVFIWNKHCPSIAGGCSVLN